MELNFLCGHTFKGLRSHFPPKYIGQRKGERGDYVNKKEQKLGSFILGTYSFFLTASDSNRCYVTRNTNKKVPEGKNTFVAVIPRNPLRFGALKSVQISKKSPPHFDEKLSQRSISFNFLELRKI